MDCFINVSATDKGVAKLVLLGDLDLTKEWGIDKSEKVLYAFRNLDMREVLGLIDSTPERTIEADFIPQFGSKESLMKVPMLVLNSGRLNYGQLGFALKQDLDSSITANIKFGENHGKGASLLGLVNCSKGTFTPSSLTNGFVLINDYSVKEEIVIKLFLRIPIIQELLKKAKDETINGFSEMEVLTLSTKKRRGQCIRAIIKDLYSLGDIHLNKRLDNIFWSI